ncbi:DUF4190 domain-containing protein [Streptomyces sp. NPDC060194]|uniref:DUF4190 domain-containing protein n=1 Tax=Streptomyces sp. NPDC060194 TaxID=3347069 RepID=UPI00364A4A82
MASPPTPPIPPPSVPSPTGPGPYGGYRPFPPVAPHVPVNGFAIASLVTGVLCFLPGVGLVLGAVGLLQIRRRRERGTGLAAAGMALSGVGLAVALLLGATGAAKDFADGFRYDVEAAARRGALADLAAGDCYDPVGRQDDEEVSEVVKRSCAQPHAGEVFAVFPVEGFDSYPGDEKLDAIGADTCWERQTAFTMDTWAVPAGVEMYYFVPLEESWRLGDRSVTCAMVDERGRRKGSVRADEQSHDKDQAAFLRSVNAVDVVSSRMPVADPEDDLGANRKYAAEVRAALDTELSALSGHAFSPEARKRVAAYVAERARAVEDWERAADASDADEFWAACGEAEEAMGLEAEIPVRKALGLEQKLPKWYTDPADDVSV